MHSDKRIPPFGIKSDLKFIRLLDSKNMLLQDKMLQKLQIPISWKKSMSKMYKYHCQDVDIFNVNFTIVYSITNSLRGFVDFETSIIK